VVIVQRGPVVLERDAVFQDELDALVTDEGRRSTHLVLPFLLPTLYFVTLVLGDAMARPLVRALVGAQFAMIVVRWGVLVTMSRTRARVQAGAFMVSAWLISASFAATYIAAAPMLDSLQILTLTVMGTGVCAVAMLSMSRMLASYLGYIVIHLGALVVVMVRHADPKLGYKGPLLLVLMMVVLGAIAVRTSRAGRANIVLAMKLRESALRDVLTGMRNRLFATELANQLSAQVMGDWTPTRGRAPVMQKRSLALFIIDIDHFKAINDTYGHAAGDRVLKAFAAVAQSAVRGPDVVVRWGGEEFLVLMETRDRTSVMKIAERLRRELAGCRLVEGGVTLSATCSIGASLFPFDEEHPDALTWEGALELADRALYEAKAAGRDRAVQAGQSRGSTVRLGATKVPAC
jgi:diguanylate cyclase (GGDEF)-like protein